MKPLVFSLVEKSLQFERFLLLTGLYLIVVDQGKWFVAMKLMSDKIRETDVKAHLTFFDAI